VEGLDGIVFSETASLQWNRKSSLVFIQTDKSMYKPDGKVQFRILVVDGNTKPLDLSTYNVKVWINDPKGNKIKEWKNIQFKNGVFKSEMTLPREPKLGRWTVNVDYKFGNNKDYRSNVSFYFFKPFYAFDPR
jgi:uncharacterized protein YfaS (alpha-2-macroglobulin family)